jgi:hypothetical protein
MPGKLTVPQVINKFSTLGPEGPLLSTQESATSSSYEQRKLPPVMEGNANMLKQQPSSTVDKRLSSSLRVGQGVNLSP